MPCQCTPFSKKAYLNRCAALLFKGKLNNTQRTALLLFSALAMLKRNVLSENFPISYLAYVLATVYHETAYTMKPIEEYGKGKGRPYGEPNPETGQTYYGRGYVQITWLENYAKAIDVVRDMNTLERGHIDFVQVPDLALSAANSAQITMSGMIDGWFTGRKMSDYLDSPEPDYINARRIINGTDKAIEIAAHSMAFEQAIRLATGESIERRTIQYGIKNCNDTRELQILLGVTVDGAFGNKTKQALISLQRRLHLVGDGICGSATWSTIDREIYNK
ncbi:peptidoglycan-binding protein [Vibrio sp. YMD68]|uniref:peptidoglycan-binding protein n=1 Tax=Vibrio sp. YMD68 TaxID=3042300 RepID=UPI00249BE9F6|nr:peptidoglycan-binding protein [Vibrio sp. YMD68]WGV98813.1 peptidoglycan-binding protein [Vibrio sp. YMD68]WGW01260.1 peptidoglycan-binding protein [Vibrio sp. YMD68]